MLFFRERCFVKSITSGNDRRRHRAAKHGPSSRLQKQGSRLGASWAEIRTRWETQRVVKTLLLSDLVGEEDQRRTPRSPSLYSPHTLSFPTPALPTQTLMLEISFSNAQMASQQTTPLTQRQGGREEEEKGGTSSSAVGLSRCPSREKKGERWKRTNPLVEIKKCISPFTFTSLRVTIHAPREAQPKEKRKSPTRKPLSVVQSGARTAQILQAPL